MGRVTTYRRTGPLERYAIAREYAETKDRVKVIGARHGISRDRVYVILREQQVPTRHVTKPKTRA